MPFLLIFLIISLTEIGVFIIVGEHIGLGVTLLLAFLTAAIGSIIIKIQGLQTILAARKSMEDGQMPVQEIFDGFCLVAAGATLITPGFVTDTTGFLLLVPAVRRVLRKLISKYANTYTSFSSFQTGRGKPRDPDIIEGEYERLDGDREP